jgi:transposase-like protein
MFLSGNGYKNYKPKKLKKKKKINEFIIDETAVKVDSELIWLGWVAIIEPTKYGAILSFDISKERKICLLHPNVFFHI